MNFPTTRPDAGPSRLWWLQNDLLRLAEQKLGPRDKSKEIYQPGFHPDGPHLINTPTMDGAFALLSPNAAGYWPTAVYELAHETVHLLNPTAGNTNWLEEGVAVAFSVVALGHYDLPTLRPSPGAYLEALSLVQGLPNGPFPTARRVREVAGALNAVSFEQLIGIVPGHDQSKLLQLAAPCMPR